MSSSGVDPARTAAVEAGEGLLRLVRIHVDQAASGNDEDDVAEQADRALWEAVAGYGDALDVLYSDDEDDADATEPDELTFTVRTRYDYTDVDEKAFLADRRCIAGAIEGLLQRAGGKPVPALKVASLETGTVPGGGGGRRAKGSAGLLRLTTVLRRGPESPPHVSRQVPR